MKQPYIYSMPESFLRDKNVPARWRVLAVINGFILNGGCFYGSNEWLMEQLGCSQQTISSAFSELEELKEIRTERTKRSRRVYKSSRDTNELVSETLTGSVRDPKQLVPNSVSISEKNTSVAIAPQFTIEREDKPDKKSNAKYPHAPTVFSWFPNPQKSWALNTTELKHAELLFDRGEDKVKSRLRYLKENEDSDFLPSITKPSDLERKWVDLEAYAKRNR